MNEHTHPRGFDFNSLRFVGLLLLLIISGFLLTGRLIYLYVSDETRFPISKVKIAASYKHVSHQTIEDLLNKHLKASFFSLSVYRLQKELNEVDWIDKAYVERIWPDTVSIKLVEKKPVAFWNGSLMTESGKLFEQGEKQYVLEIPKFSGPNGQQLDVLQVYKKLSKILETHGLKSTGLALSDNLSWVLTLENDTKIYLGKKDLNERLLRFCRAYPAVFSQKATQLSCVDLRYPRGMAVQWKQQTEQ